MAPLSSTGTGSATDGVGSGLGNTYLLETRNTDFDENTAATHVAITAITGRRIIVTKIFLAIAGTQTLQFASGATVLSGPIPFTTDDYLELGNSDGVVFRGDQIGEAFNIILTQAQQVVGYINYVTISE